MTGLLQVLGELAGHVEGFGVVDDDEVALHEAMRQRISSPQDYVLDNAAIAALAELAARNF